jgi:hypothetical protein
VVSLEDSGRFARGKEGSLMVTFQVLPEFPGDISLDDWRGKKKEPGSF